MINRIRILLINTGKILPFVLCVTTCLSYCECLYSLLTKDFVVYGDSIVLNKPISWFLGTWFEYKIQLLIVLTILSFAIRTCIYNKIAIAYAYLNLFEKDYFESVELYIDVIYIIVLINIIISALLSCKGISLYIKLSKKNT